MGQPVTHVVRVQAHLGVSTAVEADTQQRRAIAAILVIFVLAVGTVVDAVAAHEDGQAVAAPWALEVGLGATGAEVVELSSPRPLEVDDCGRWRTGRQFDEPLLEALLLVGGVAAVDNGVAPVFQGDTLHKGQRQM